EREETMLDRYDASASRPLSVNANRWERGQRRRGEGSWSIRRPRIRGKPAARWSSDVAGAAGKRVERDGARPGSSSLVHTTSERGLLKRRRPRLPAGAPPSPPSASHTLAVVAVCEAACKHV